MFLFLKITKASHMTGKDHMLNEAMVARLKPISPNEYLAINIVEVGRMLTKINATNRYTNDFKGFHSSLVGGLACDTFFLLSKEE